ncbi:hypothetical protein D3C85_681630 [compost metagenome]
MQSVERVEKWLEDMQFKIDLEEDPIESRLLWEQKHSIEVNLEHYIKRKIKDGEHHYSVKTAGRLSLQTITMK